MQNQSANYLVSSIFLHPLKQVCAEKYIDPVRLLAKCNLPVECLYKDDLDIDHYAFAQVLNEGAKISGDKLFGIQLAKLFSLSTAGPIGMLLAKQTTLNNIYPIVGYLLDAQNRGAIHGLKVKGQYAYHYMTFFLQEQINCHQNALFSLAGFNIMFSQLLGKRWQLKKVLISEANEADISRLQDYFGCQVLAGQNMDALVFSAELIHQEMDEKVFEGGLKLRKEMAALLNEFEDLQGLVKSYIKYLMPEGKANKNAVAKSLGIHPSVLQQCLYKRGLEFKNLLAKTRQEEAEHLLNNTDFSIEQIALELGYTGSDVFGRAFKNWTGITPLKWRTNQRK